MLQNLTATFTKRLRLQKRIQKFTANLEFLHSFERIHFFNHNGLIEIRCLLFCDIYIAEQDVN